MLRHQNKLENLHQLQQRMTATSIHESADPGQTLRLQHLESLFGTVGAASSGN